MLLHVDLFPVNPFYIGVWFEEMVDYTTNYKYYYADTVGSYGL